MLPPDAVIITTGLPTVTKRDIVMMVQLLFVAECNSTIVPNDKVRKAMAEELVALMLNLAA